MSRRMTSPPGSPVAPSGFPASSQPGVAVVVLAENGAVQEETLAALNHQVYVPVQTLIVGASGSAASTLAKTGYQLLESSDQVLGKLHDEVDFVWCVHGDTRPRPDSLGALVYESLRNDASIAGSKVLIEGEDDRLDSVGEATDAFGEPYSGLDPGELDLEQYDVVREVAFVSPVSLLVRRDLWQGLRGLDLSLPLEAAGLDLSQRGRVAGGRVIVVPSSEVFHPSDCTSLRPGWRQLAGRQKAMLNAYRPITLAWVLPIGLLIGLADGIGQLMLGRLGPLVSHIRSWLWNLVNLRSSFIARRVLRRVRQVGDEELFRFQVRGSVMLRRTFTEVGARFNRVIDQEDPASIADRAVRTWQRPIILLGVLSTLAVVVGTRQIWFAGTPQVGFSLPPAGEGSGILSAYGGGWNPTGLGSPEAAPPVVALGALAEILTGGRAELAHSLLTLAAIGSGFLGASRLARRAGASSAAGQVAAWVYIAGSAMSALAGAGQWPILLAAGALPWALDAVLSPGATSWRRRLGRIGRGGLAAGLMAMAFPPLLIAIPGVGGLWAIFSGRRAAFLMGLTVSGIGAGLIAPFVVSGDVMNLLAAAPVPSIEPDWLWPVSIIIAGVLGTLLARPQRLAGVALGGVMAGLGWLVGRLPTVLSGVGMSALLLGGLGAGVLAAMLVDIEARPWWTRLASWAGVLILLAPAAVTVAGGRAGLPPDRWSNTLAFVHALAGESRDVGRVLVIGPGAELPGTSRSHANLHYRLIDGGVATLDQAYLPAFGPGDAALDGALEQALVQGADLRPGEALAAFGVRWVVVLPGAGVAPEVLERQVDLIERPVNPDLAIYENLAPGGRAVTDAGIEWFWDGLTYRGAPSVGRVRLADSSHPGWGPGGTVVDGWANSVEAQEGQAMYQPDPLTRVAGLTALGLFFTLLATAWWGRATPAGPTARHTRRPEADPLGEPLVGAGTS